SSDVCSSDLDDEIVGADIERAHVADELQWLRLPQGWPVQHRAVVLHHGQAAAMFEIAKALHIEKTLALAPRKQKRYIGLARTQVRRHLAGAADVTVASALNAVQYFHAISLEVFKNACVVIWRWARCRSCCRDTQRRASMHRLVSRRPGALRSRQQVRHRACEAGCT